MSVAPAVSVVITCYNLGEYLDEAVDSVLSQTFQDFEILIIDDGSTGDTQALLASYARPKTRVLRIENSGLPAARNTGIRHTSGSFLCMLDADDCLEPAYMERSVQVLREDSTLGFVSHWLRTFGDETLEWTPHDCSVPSLLSANPVNGAALFRREAWSATGGFDETMRDGLEDWDFWISLVEHGWPGRILPEFLFRYRRRGASMSRIMMRGELYASLYRALIDKHPASYRKFLPEFLRATEQDTGALLAHIHQLETEHHEWLGPEVMSLRDDVAVLEAKVARMQARRDDAARLADDRDRLAGDRDRLSTELAVVSNTTRELTKRLDLARAEIDALRHSGSWRVTWPLRVVYGWVLKLRQRGGERRG